MKEKLSVVIITYNEEHNIKRCLDAAWLVADEIIVVDSFSTDKTKDICLDNNVQFFEHIFEGYGNQKNYAIRKANNNFILSLDADEVLSETLIESINQVKVNPNFKAYSLNRMSYYIDKFIKYGHWFPDKKIRLFHKDYGKWTDDDVHEIVKTKARYVPLLKGLLLHYTFTSISEHLAQANKFSTIGGKQLAKRSHFYLLAKAMISPVWGFFYGYFLKLGFLDGWHGISIAIISSSETFMKYSKAHFYSRNPVSDRLRVLHISSLKSWRGGEQQVVSLVNNLNSIGIHNHLVVARGSELGLYCKKNNLSYSSIIFGNGFNFFAAWRLRIICKRQNIDIVHMHCSPSHTLAIFGHRFGIKSKLILSRRVIFPIRKNRLSQQKFNYPAIERIICVSEAIKKTIEKDIKRNNIFDVVYDGIEVSKATSFDPNISIREEFSIGKKTLVVIIAALSAEKDHPTFIRAAQAVLAIDSDFHFLIVGSGSELNHLRHLILAYSLSEHITLTGFRNDVPNILHEANIFALTSVEEGLGSAIIEAFANKVPVIATNVGGIPELVIHEKTGLLVLPRQPELLAQNIIRLKADRVLRENLIQGASAHLDANFRIENTAAKTIKVYENVMAEA